MTDKSKSNIFRLQPSIRCNIIDEVNVEEYPPYVEKILEFLSLHITQTVESKMRWIPERIFFENPPNHSNWSKWSETHTKFTVIIPNQWETKTQILPKKSQCINKWSVSLSLPQPPIQNCVFDWNTPSPDFINLCRNTITKKPLCIETYFQRSLFMSDDI